MVAGVSVGRVGMENVSCLVWTKVMFFLEWVVSLMDLGDTVDFFL